MTSSHDARQDWQASVLRDLTPIDGEKNGRGGDTSPEPEVEAHDESATLVVNPATLGITLPTPPSAAPEPPEPAESPESLPGHAATSDPLGMQEPAAPQAGYPATSFAGFPASPQFGHYPPPATPPAPGTAPPATTPPPSAPPAFPPQQVYAEPQAPAQPQAHPGTQPYPQQRPPVPAPQQYPAQPHPTAAPQHAPVAYPAYQQHQQHPGYPATPGYPPPVPPAGPPAPLGDPPQGRSRVFGPDATPVPEQWTPDGLLAMPNHADNWHQRIRSSVRGVGGSASKASREAAEIARELTQPVTTGRRIAVLGIRGGSGKSTVASLLASAYATHRGDRVLAVDADPDLGSLGLRLGASSPTSLVRLGRVPRVWQTVDDAERCLGRAPSGAWVLAGERDTAGPESVTPNAYLGVLHGISRYFAVTVVDAGAGMVTPLNQSVLGDPQTIVRAPPASIDGVVSARRALEWVREWGSQRLPQTVVALTAMSPQAGEIDMTRTIDALAPFGVHAVLLPYDRHLATGSTIEPWRLGERTRNSAVQLAAASLSRARAVGSPPNAAREPRFGA